jgi:phage terminase large subunit-like protein
MADATTAYAKKITSGKIVAGRLVKLACQRHLDDLGPAGKKRGLIFDVKAAEKALDFFPHFLRLSEGEHAAQPFVLQPWQAFIVGSLFGWKGRDGFRRFRTAYIETAKGNGKTPLLAGLGLYGIMFDDEPGAQVFAAAVTREQAGGPASLFADAKAMAELSPGLSRELTVGEHNIAHEASRSFLRPVSSEGRSLDTKRVHMALIDEIHEHRTDIVVNKLRAGTKGRRQALIAEITNAGYDRASVCWAHHEYSAKVLEGLVPQDTWFAYVCGLDPCEQCRAEGYLQPKDGCATCDDWRERRVWLKANPNLGVSITAKYLREQVEEAGGMPTKRDIVLRLNFCIWTASHVTWIPVDRWRTCSDRVADDDLQAIPCWAGLDLGQTDDFSALALAFILPDGRVALRLRYWVPEAAVAAHPERPYAAWRAAGYLTTTEGDVTDYDRIEQEVEELCSRWAVRELAYDKRFAEQMAQRLAGRGITCVDMPQGYQLNEGIVKLETLVKSGKLAHGGDPVLAWMVSNVALRRGTRGEVRLDKEKAADKIDGVAAAAMAMARAITQPSGSIYDTRGVLVL